ncbi:MAG: (2Fe-2S)-binding protein, partial [Holophagales bacterium]|nr:(2Fe-2S)-binding protein [Holophagales bacterium]
AGQDDCVGPLRERRPDLQAPPQRQLAAGIFCANGQCAQCSVVANGLSVKSCMVPVTEGMAVAPLDGKAALLDADGDLRFHDVETIETECLILGGGPAGLAAAVETQQEAGSTLSSSTTRPRSAASWSSRHTSSSAPSKRATRGRAAWTSAGSSKPRSARSRA